MGNRIGDDSVLTTDEEKVDFFPGMRIAYPRKRFLPRKYSLNSKDSEEVDENLNELANFDIFPSDVLHNVFQFIDLSDLFTSMQCCKLFYKVIQTEYFLRCYCAGFSKSLDSYFGEDITQILGGSKCEEGIEEKSWREKIFQVKNLHFKSRDKYYRKLLTFRPLKPPKRSEKDYVEFSNERTFDFLFKIILIGDSRCGRSSLMLRFAEDRFEPSLRTTIGVDFKIRTIWVNEFTTKLQIWDIANQTYGFTRIGDSYRGADGILLCFDLNNPKSFEESKSRMKELETYRNEGVLQGYVILVGCKSDLERKVNFSMVYELFQDYTPLLTDISSQYCECSSKDDVCHIPFGMMVELMWKSRFKEGFFFF